MNSLSWLIYASDAFEGMGVFLRGLAGVSGIASAIIILALSVDKEADQSGKMRKRLYWLMPCCICAALVTALLPSRSTVMMIAASEVAGTAAQSEAGREVLNELRSSILAQLRKSGSAK